MPAKIAIVYYSMYGHIKTLALEAAKGAKAAGVTVDVFQFPETLSEEILGKMHAAPKDSEVEYITPSALKEYDGFIFAFPTRYGRAVAQASSFFDATGQLWATGALVGKFATLITSTASQNGGQETTHLTTIPFLTHHGIIYVPIGYANQDLVTFDEIHGGSPYGASTMSKSDGSRQPTTLEKGVAEYQGKYFGGIVNTFIAGKAALSSAPTVAALQVPESAQAPIEPATEKPTKEAGGYNLDAAKPTPAAKPATTTKPAAKEEDAVGERKGWKKYVCC